MSDEDRSHVYLTPEERAQVQRETNAFYERLLNKARGSCVGVYEGVPIFSIDGDLSEPKVS